MAVEQSLVQRLTESETGLSYLSVATSTDLSSSSLLGSPKLPRTILFIHGYGCRAADFIPLMETLVSNHASSISPSSRYLALDLPGHGESPPSACPEPSTPEFAEIVLKFVKVLELQDVFLVGHSMGCRVAVTAAASAYGYSQRPSRESTLEDVASGHTPEHKPLAQRNDLRIRGLILLDGSSFGLLQKGIPAHKPPITASDPSSNSIEAAFYTMFSPKTPPLFQKAILDHLRNGDENYLRKLRKTHRAFDSNSLEAVTKFLGGCMVEESGIKKPFPILVIQATTLDLKNQRKSFTSISERNAYMDWMAEMAPRASFKVILESGHFPHIDETEECAISIAGFCKNHSG